MARLDFIYKNVSWGSDIEDDVIYNIDFQMQNVGLHGKFFMGTM